MSKETLTLWYIPLESVPNVLNTLREECCSNIMAGETEKADALLYAIKGIERDYQNEIEELKRLVEEDDN